MRGMISEEKKKEGGEEGHITSHRQVSQRRRSGQNWVDGSDVISIQRYFFDCPFFIFYK